MYNCVLFLPFRALSVCAVNTLDIQIYHTLTHTQNSRYIYIRRVILPFNRNKRTEKEMERMWKTKNYTYIYIYVYVYPTAYYIDD